MGRKGTLPLPLLVLHQSLRSQIPSYTAISLAAACRAHSQGWLPGHVTCAVTQVPTLGLMPSCCRLESLDLVPGAPHFHFALGPANDVAGPAQNIKNAQS